MPLDWDKISNPETKTTVFKMHGSLSADTVRKFREVARDEVGRCPDEIMVVEFDLADLTHLDSSGIGLLVSAWILADSLGGHVYLTEVHDQPEATLRQVRLLDKFAKPVPLLVQP